MKKSSVKKSERNIFPIAIGALFLVYLFISLISNTDSITPKANESDIFDDGLCIDSKTGLIRLPEEGEVRAIISSKQIVTNDGTQSYLVHSYQCISK